MATKTRKKSRGGKAARKADARKGRTRKAAPKRERRKAAPVARAERRARPLASPDVDPSTDVPDEIAIVEELSSQVVADSGTMPATDAAHTPALSGGDVDAGWDQADSGEETVGGSTPTPDQDVVDEIGEAVGLTFQDTEPLDPTKVDRRDDERWEVDPASAEDYEERMRTLKSKKRPRR